MLRAAGLLKCGSLLAHQTGTISGVAALPQPSSLIRLQRFKGRRGPFLLLASSKHAALRLASNKLVSLRRAATKYWPGPVTLVFAGGAHLPSLCRQQGRVAVRVDADPATRLLCRLAGGLLVSSSLNRRGKPPMKPDRHTFYRLHRHLCGYLPARYSVVTSGRPSMLLGINRRGSRKIRA